MVEMSHMRSRLLTNLHREAADFRFFRQSLFASGGMSVRRNAMKPHGLTLGAPHSSAEAEVGRFESPDPVLIWLWLNSTN
jgi:hypothetical protein